MISKIMKIIVGLGNPGKEYNGTRHNAGAMVLDELAGGESWRESKKFQALTLERGGDLWIKPLTYMNLSGSSVRAILDYYHLIPKKLGLFRAKDSDLSDILVVLHDDLDIELGKYKVSDDSRSGGHRGVESIINTLKTKKFKRIRLGIKNELRDRIPAEKFVLQKFAAGEWEKIEKMITAIATEIK